jgi:hypothetical protein
MLLVAGCVTTKTTPQKSKWKVLDNKSTHGASSGINPKSNFVPTGTELLFTSTKSFSSKDTPINIELSPEKRCSLSSSDKKIESKLDPNTILTVVGYRGETGDLVLSEPSYQQYIISCLSKVENQKRKTSSVVKPMAWKKISIEMDDLEKMSPLLKLKFIPQ